MCSTSLHSLAKSLNLCGACTKRTESGVLWSGHCCSGCRLGPKHKFNRVALKCPTSLITTALYSSQQGKGTVQHHVVETFGLLCLAFFHGGLPLFSFSSLPLFFFLLPAFRSLCPFCALVPSSCDPCMTYFLFWFALFSLPLCLRPLPFLPSFACTFCSELTR